MKRIIALILTLLCVLALAGMLIAVCLAFVFENDTPMYDFSGVKAQSDKFYNPFSPEN